MYEYPLKVRYARKAADVLGYVTETIDTFSHYLIKISSGRRFVFVGSGNIHSYPINNATVASLATDKAHTYTLLEQIGIAVPRSQLIFVDDRFADLRPPGCDLADAKAFAARIGYPVFVKPNQGSRGTLAQSVADQEALEQHVAEIAKQFYSALVQEYLRGVEQRIFCIDGVPWFAYAKTKPAAIADGERTVSELLRQVDEKLRRSGLSTTNRSDPELQAFMRRTGFSWQDIPAAGTEIPYSEKANVSWGGGVVNFREEFTDSETELCRRIYASTDLRVCAIDLIGPGGGDAWQQTVLELNANPALSSLERLGKTELLTQIWIVILEKALGADGG